MRKNSVPEFWVTNRSTERDVALADLHITIRRCKSINLLNKHFHYTIEELEASAATGSIHKKSNFISFRRVAPKPAGKMFKEIVQRMVMKPIRNAVKLEDKKFEELELSPTPVNFDEVAEAAAVDHRPLLAVDKKYFREDDEPAPSQDWGFAEDDELVEGSNSGEDDDY